MAKQLSKPKITLKKKNDNIKKTEIKSFNGRKPEAITDDEITTPEIEDIKEQLKEKLNVSIKE